MPRFLYFYLEALFLVDKSPVETMMKKKPTLKGLLQILLRACVLSYSPYWLIYGPAFLFSGKLVAQMDALGFRFQHYSTRQGLANNLVLSIAEDANGFIWAGTLDGVSRFDGFQFKNFNLSIKDSTANSNRNVVEKIRLVNGEIWAMNRLYELYRFDPSSADFIFTGLKGTYGWKGKQDGNFPDFLFDKGRNCIWMVDFKNLVKLSLTGGPPISYPIFEYGKCHGSIVFDFKNRLWMISENGLIRFEPDNGSVFRFLPNRQVFCQFLSGQYLWFMGETDNLYCVDLRTDSLAVFSAGSDLSLSAKAIRDAVNIAFHPSRNLALETSQLHSGLLALNLKSGKEIDHLFVDNMAQIKMYSENIFEFFISKDSVLWMATVSGLLKMDPRQQHLITQEISHFKKNNIGKVRAVLSHPQKKGAKWVLSNSDGLFEFDEKTQQVSKPLFSPLGSPVDFRDMAFDGRKNLTLVGQNGLFQVFQDGRFRLTNPQFEGDPVVKLFLPIHEDSVWVSNRKEVGLFLPRTGTFLPLKNGFSDIYYLNQGEKGSLLVSELNGLYRVPLTGFDPAKGYFTAVEKIGLPDGEKEGRDALEDGPLIWSVLSSGLGRLEKATGKWDVFGEKEGLSNMRIRSMLKDQQGNLWLNSDNGLFVFFPTDRRFKLFTEDDGLPQNLVGGILSDDGDWFHACFEDSYMSWKPNARLQKAAKKPIFTGFWALNRPVSLHTDSLGSALFKVRHSENILRFEFTSTDFYQSEKISFEYQLEGFDEQPVAAGTTRWATYTNLDGGTYALKVWAINADGYRCAAPAVLRFRVIPPFYRTGWFMGLCLMVVSSMVYALFQVRLRQRLEKEAIRLRIARDLHDEVGSTLTTISILSDSVLRNVELDSEQARLSGIGEKARSAMSSMSDIVWAVNPQNDTMDKVLERMTHFAAETLEGAGITPVFEIDKAVHGMHLKMEQRKDFYLFFKEATTNVAKHSRASKAVFSLKKKDGHLVFELRDDGIGRTEGQSDGLGGNGLRNMQARAAALGADFSMGNGEKQGFFVRLRLPLT
jgi:signal transduction histidine kinase/streptogramin lyase